MLSHSWFPQQAWQATVLTYHSSASNFCSEGPGSYKARWWLFTDNFKFYVYSTPLKYLIQWWHISTVCMIKLCATKYALVWKNYQCWDYAALSCNLPCLFFCFKKENGGTLTHMKAYLTTAHIVLYMFGNLWCWELHVAMYVWSDEPCSCLCPDPSYAIY